MTFTVPKLSEMLLCFECEMSPVSSCAYTLALQLVALFGKVGRALLGGSESPEGYLKV